MKNILYLLMIVMLFVACNNKKPVPEKRDTAITPSNSYSELFFDSLQLEQYISQNEFPDSMALMMRDFYNVRNYQYAWFTNEGLSRQAQSFWNLQRNYIEYNRDSSIYNETLQQFTDSVDQAGSTPALSDSVRLRYELEFTSQFFSYASKAYQGDKDIDPDEVKWFIPRRKVDITSMLDSLIANKGRSIKEYEPVNRQYNLLRDYLQKYSEIKNKGGWNEITSDQKKIEMGDSLPAIAMIKNRLFLTGDYTSEDTSYVFSELLKSAIMRFQQRLGLADDGVVGPGTLAALNIPLDERIRQLLVNMERLRWVPAEPPGDYILVNIPEYKLHVYEKGQYAFDMNVVVGTTQNRTVIFTDKLQNVVFSPYWNIPPGILKNEILPGIRANSRYLANHDMEWHNGYVRQRPGPNNSLGLVKFLFPNSYNIYLHDTPSKSLFKEDARAFSHGCIRVAEPIKLADWVFQNDSAWNEKTIAEAMHAGEEKYVEVNEDILVFIGYFTAWVDRQGRLNFRKDIYGHDEAMAKRMFSDLF